jgi:hypothetical protein
MKVCVAAVSHYTVYTVYAVTGEKIPFSGPEIPFFVRIQFLFTQQGLREGVQISKHWEQIIIS